MKDKHKKIFAGWWTVLASGIIGNWDHGVSTYSMGSFFKPFQDEFGWSRLEISATSSLRSVESVGIPYGVLVDKFGPRTLCMIGTLLASLGYFLMYFVNSLWSFYLVYGVVVTVGFNFAMGISLDKAITDWFLRKRGTAVGVDRVIRAIEVAPPFIALLLTLYGWRIAFVIAGLITMIIGLPLAWFFIKPNRPEYYGLMPDGSNIEIKIEDKESMIRAGQELAAKEGELEFTSSQALRTRTFWILIVTNTLGALAGPIVSMHQIPYLTDMGVDPVAAATILSFMIIAGIPARMLGGMLIDRLPIGKLKYALSLQIGLRVVGLFFFLRTTPATFYFIYLFIVIYGSGHGLSTFTTNMVRARFFGRKSFGTIATVQNIIHFPVSILLPMYIGWMYDVTGSYTVPFTTIFTLTIGGLICSFFISPPKWKTTKEGDIKNR